MSGRTMATGLAGFGLEVRPAFVERLPNVLIIERGSNDLGIDGRSGTSLYGDLAISFVSAAKAAGSYVVLNTLLPRSDASWSASKEAERTLYNQLVREDRANADAINDLAADPVLGDAVNSATSAYYADGLHTSVLGQQRLSTLVAAAVSPLLRLSPRARQG